MEGDSSEWRRLRTDRNQACGFIAADCGAARLCKRDPGDQGAREYSEGISFCPARLIGGRGNEIRKRAACGR